ncbi:MAG: type II toxin-antitoxin system HicA family toxin [Lachnospiraceae bacterium]|nr:type II toxin-antitoxin system HicA family toxin [Lachnospiraceae bacterium]
MPMKPVEMVKLLEKSGFAVISQNGSHIKLRNPETGKQVIVPMHSKEMKKGTEQDILKRAGLK